MGEGQFGCAWGAVTVIVSWVLQSTATTRAALLCSGWGCGRAFVLLLLLRPWKERGQPHRTAGAP